MNFDGETGFLSGSDDVQPGKPTGRRRLWLLWLRFFVGSSYLACIAAVFVAITGSSFLWMVSAVFPGAILVGILALAWLTGWAQRADSRLGQFGIPSLLFLTLFVAIFFSIVRWLVVNLRGPTAGVNDTPVTIAIASVCLLLFALGVPLMTGFMESLVWSAVWLLRRAPVRRWLLRRHERRASRFDEDA
jgi:hypothetical protein